MNLTTIKDQLMNHQITVNDAIQQLQSLLLRIPLTDSLLNQYGFYDNAATLQKLANQLQNHIINDVDTLKYVITNALNLPWHF